MKKQILFWAVSCLFFCSALSAQDVRGVWKRTMPESRAKWTEVKFITDGHFLWVLYDKKSDIKTGAGGTYTFENGVYTETILYTLPDMKRFEKKRAVYNVTFEDDGTMRIEGKLDRKIPVWEVWKRME